MSPTTILLLNRWRRIRWQIRTAGLPVSAPLSAHVESVRAGAI